MHYSNPWQAYGHNPYHAYYAAANPYFAGQYYDHAQAQSLSSKKNVANLIQSEWSAQFGPTLVLMVISIAILWFKIYGGKLVGDKAQAELLQTGVVAGAVVMVLSVAVNIFGMSSGITAADMIWIHMALILITCVLLWNHVAHIVAIHAKPSPEDEKKSSSSRSSSSRSSSSSTSSSKTRSSSEKDPTSSSSRSPGSSSSQPSSSSSPSSSSRAPSPSSSDKASRPPTSSSRSAEPSSSASKPSSSSSSSASRPYSSSSSRSSNSSSGSSSSSRSAGASSSSANKSSSSKDKEKPEEEENPDPWGKAHPSSKLSRDAPRLWPFPIGLATVASKTDNGKERLWWESGTPHEVGYITRSDGRNLGEVPNPSESPIKSGSSEEKSSSSSASSSSIPKPSAEELAELKAIMKGEKQLSEDKTKRARQKELMKLMMAKKSEGKGEGSSSSRSAPSAPPLTPKPTAEELTELKDIVKGEKQFSEDKTKRARQKELMNLMMAKTSSKTDGPQSPSDNATPKKGVRFEDQAIAGASSKSSTSSSLPEAATSASLESKSTPSRTGPSSRSSDPAAKSSSSGSSRKPSGSSSHRRDSEPAPIEPIVNDELAKKRKMIKYMKMMTVVAAVAILNYTIGFLALLGFLLFMMEEYTNVDQSDDSNTSQPTSVAAAPRSSSSSKPSSSSSSKPSSSLPSSDKPSSSSSSSRPSSSSKPSSSSSSSRPGSSSSSSSSSGSSSRRTITEEEKAALPTSTKKKEKESEIKPLPPISMMYLAQPDVKVPGIWKGPELRMVVQGTTTPLMTSVYGP